MASIIALLGIGVGALLIALLLATLAHPTFRIWPINAPGTAKSLLWWTLFRGLNVLAFATAVTSTRRAGFLGLPLAVRLFAALALVGAIAVFVYAFRVLGRDNSYGASDGLVTSGIYQWTRNPQNVMLMAVYTALALAADSGPAYLVCGAMIAVYYLMIRAEEPWLAGIYGDAYRDYCARVPRIFNWRRLLGRAD